MFYETRVIWIYVDSDSVPYIYLNVNKICDLENSILAKIHITKEGKEIR